MELLLDRISDLLSGQTLIGLRRHIGEMTRQIIHVAT